MATLNNIKKNILTLLVILGIGLFSSCYYDKKDQIYPQVAVTACDTTNITYQAVVAPILNTNCNSCHAASVANKSGAGIVLDNYVSLKPYITNSSLLNSIVQNGKVPPMPLNAPKLDACKISKIAAWINKGALNN
jgi:mono/diheme cytochrome c family protein